MRIEWTEGPKLPVGLGGHVAANVDGRVVVVGGTYWKDEKKRWSDAVWVLEGDRWRAAAKLPVELAMFAPVMQRDSLLLLGGATEQGATARSFRYAKGDVTDGPVKELPSARALAGGAHVGETTYVIGGWTDAADPKTATASVIRLQDGAWQEAAPLPRALGLAATVTAGEKVFVFGGMGPGADGVAADLAEGYCYDAAQNQWTKIAALPGARRGVAAAALDDAHILIVGGCRGASDGLVILDEVLVYDIRDDRYRACTPLPFSALCVQPVVKDGRVYVIGGEDRPKHRTDRVVIGKVELGK